MRDVLLIPGIGGHPRFHGPLVDALRRRHRVHTSPHGDFFGEPFTSLQQHVAFWKSFSTSIDSAQICVVAVSFGVHVLPRLIPSISSRVSQVVLVSPWVADVPGTSALRLLSIMPANYVASFLATLLRRWSDGHSHELPLLDALRKELYDDPARVARCWRQRLLAVRDGLDWRGLRRLSRQHCLTAVFGEQEWLYRLQRFRLQSLRRMQPAFSIRLLQGGHEIGTSDLAAGDQMERIIAAV